MKRLSALFASFALTAAGLLAHGGNEHVRGVVSAVSPQSITVQTTSAATRTLTVSTKTAVKQAGKAAQIADVKVGDRVVIDVPEKSTDATLIQIGEAPKPAAAKK